MILYLEFILSMIRLTTRGQFVYIEVFVDDAQMLRRFVLGP